ncbi:c-type cytochrome [Geothrix limicola]|uniref:c-type cytochrome n=1 Tax=Geothrix limicola TaxID=2927978 RepID=UPI003B75B921
MWSLIIVLFATNSCDRKQEKSAAVAAVKKKQSSVQRIENPTWLLHSELSVSYELRLGKHVFLHYCQICHGKTGAGDGFNAFNILPRPRDLSDPIFQNSMNDERLTGTIFRGGKEVGLSATMPPWGKTLSHDQINQVMRYVRNLKRVDHLPS